MSVDLPPIRVLSLCSGGGGLDLGVVRALTRLGRAHRAVAYVEREAYACAVLAARMEEGALAPAPIWSDLATLDARPLRGAVDLVVSGVPCQGNSVAGKRLGRADERWLWPHVERVLSECQPEWFLLENVRGLLSVDRGAAFGDILESLARSGFDAEWLVLGARDVGAPHRRERVFLLAHAERDQLRHEPGRSGGQDGQGASESRDDGAQCDVVDTDHARLERWCLRGRKRADERALGATDGTMVADTDGRRLEGERGRGLPNGDAARGHDADGRGSGTAWPPGPDDATGWRDYLAEHSERAPAIESPLRGSVDGLAERLGATRAEELRLLGNGVVPAQAEHAFIELYERFENNR